MSGRTVDLQRRSLVVASVFAAGGAAAIPRRSAAAELTEAERANVALVENFCAAWSTLDLERVTALMSDDTVYRMSETTPPVTGHQALIDQMQPWVDTSHAIEFRILETFAKGPIVVTHRVDTFSSDTRPLQWEGVGVFLVRDRKIKEWSDYTIRVGRG
jgi:limonene-1,2-epoxide hydrolase